MPRLKHIHSSGRFDRSARAIRAGLDSYADRGVDVLTLTEHRNARHKRVTRQWADEHGYEVAEPTGGGDCSVAVRSAAYRIKRVWERQLSDHEQRRGPGGPPPPKCLTVLVEHLDSHEEFLVSVAHLPSNVEGDWNDRGRFRFRVWRTRRRNRRVTRRFKWRPFVWRDARKTWGRHLWRLRRHHRVKVIQVADWNLNLERRRFRVLLRTLHPRLRLTWRKFPGPGTHHRRVIDGTLTNMRIVEGAELLPDDRSSDHRPYVEVLAF